MVSSWIEGVNMVKFAMLCFSERKNGMWVGLRLCWCGERWFCLGGLMRMVSRSVGDKDWHKQFGVNGLCLESFDLVDGNLE